MLPNRTALHSQSIFVYIYTHLYIQYRPFIEKITFNCPPSRTEPAIFCAKIRVGSLIIPVWTVLAAQACQGLYTRHHVFPLTAGETHFTKPVCDQKMPCSSGTSAGRRTRSCQCQGLQSSNTWSAALSFTSENFGSHVSHHKGFG